MFVIGKGAGPLKNVRYRHLRGGMGPLAGEDKNYNHVKDY